jgi:hypothetical protein
MSTPDAPFTPAGAAPTSTTPAFGVPDASPYAPHGAPAGGFPVVPPQRRSGLAIAAFVLGLLSILVCLIPLVNVLAVVGGLIAVVLGIVALRKLVPGAGGKGFAITGIVLGAVSLVVAVLMLVVIGTAVKSLDDSGELDAILEEVEAAQEAGAPVEEPEAVASEAPAEAVEAAPAEAPAGAPDVVREDFAGLDCDALGAEAVAMSQESADAGAVLLDVRESTPVEDHRTDYAVPAGADESLVLSCRGTAAWDDATQTSVLTELTIDADAELYVFYTAE